MPLSPLRRFVSLAVVAAAIVAGGATGAQERPAEAARPWLFVADRDYPPLSFFDNGVAKGLDVDLVRELARVLRRDIRIELLEFGEARRRVLAGEADAVTDLGISPERREQFDFSLATVTHEFGLYVRRGDRSVLGLAELSGKRVGVTTSPFAREFLARQVDAQLVLVRDFDDGFRQLVSGDLDVAAFDSWVAALKARDYARDVELVGAPFATSATAIAVRKGRGELLAEINRGIAMLKAEGGLARLEERWRPREMNFLPATWVESVAAWVVGGLVAAVLATLVFWVITLKREVRERRRVEAALAASEAKFGTAFLTSPDGMAIIDLETRRMMEVSQRLVEMTGYSREELLGRTVADLALVDPGRADAARDQLLRDGAVRDVEFVVRCRDGRRVTVAGSAERMEVGGRPSALWVYRDVTAARDLEAQLRQSQKMDAVGRLAAGVAHDFNNLLTVILGNCELGAPLLRPDDPLRAALGEIRVAAERASVLTGQLAAFSRRQIVRPRILALNDAVRDQQPMLARLVGPGIAVSVSLDPDAGCVEIDPEQLHHVLVNLAAHARDAMPGGGRLAFRTRRLVVDGEARPARVPAGDYAVLEVADTGSTIDAASRERMFEPFFASRNRGQGAGIGLATVHGIVTAARGVIDVESEAGQGATFHVYWPRRGEVASAAAAPGASRLAEGAPAGGGERVLLVEDETVVRQLLGNYLERLGYQVRTAASGEEALASCQPPAWPPALLVTDIVMGGMSGRDLAEAMQARFPGVRVLYMSGYTDDAGLRRGALSSSARFLQKPFTPTTLAAAVRDALDGAA